MSLQTVLQVLGLCPALEDIVSLEYIGHHAGDVLREKLLVEPKWIECDLVPADALDLSRHPHLGRLLNLAFQGRVGMGGSAEGVVYLTSS